MKAKSMGLVADTDGVSREAVDCDREGDVLPDHPRIGHARISS